VKRVLLLVALPFVLAACGSTAESTPNVGADVARAELTVAATNVTSWYTAHGTYVGANPGVTGVTLGRADQFSFCVQDATSHLAGPGPGSAIAPGACT
jgi:hypothetical protein